MCVEPDAEILEACKSPNKNEWCIRNVSGDDEAMNIDAEYGKAA